MAHHALLMPVEIRCGDCGRYLWVQSSANKDELYVCCFDVSCGHYRQFYALALERRALKPLPAAQAQQLLANSDELPP